MIQSGNIFQTLNLFRLNLAYIFLPIYFNLVYFAHHFFGYWPNDLITHFFAPRLHLTRCAVISVRMRQLHFYDQFMLLKQLFIFVRKRFYFIKKFLSSIRKRCRFAMLQRLTKNSKQNCIIARCLFIRWENMNENIILLLSSEIRFLFVFTHSMSTVELRFIFFLHHFLVCSSQAKWNVVHLFASIEKTVKSTSKKRRRWTDTNKYLSRRASIQKEKKMVLRTFQTSNNARDGSWKAYG